MPRLRRRPAGRRHRLRGVLPVRAARMTARILDAAGHLWPVTGQRCPVCRMPADPVLDGDPHMFCVGAVPPLAPDQYAARIRAIADLLGGEVISARPLDRWRR